MKLIPGTATSLDKSRLKGYWQSPSLPAFPKVGQADGLSILEWTSQSISRWTTGRPPPVGIVHFFLRWQSLLEKAAGTGKSPDSEPRSFAFFRPGRACAQASFAAVVFLARR